MNGPVADSKWLLNPLDRAAEILFGLIMVLTFTCSISVANAHLIDVSRLLAVAVGCNIAWGLVDASMHLIQVLAQRNRNKAIFEHVRNLGQTEEARKHIAGALPPLIASVVGNETLDQIKEKLASLPYKSERVKLTFLDLKTAFAIFLTVFVSTLPVVLPFLIVKDTLIALRISNAVAVVMMFLCGWSVARYVGFNKWLMSAAMVGLGVILVGVTISLGG